MEPDQLGCECIHPCPGRATIGVYLLHYTTVVHFAEHSPHDAHMVLTEAIRRVAEIGEQWGSARFGERR